MKPRIVSRCNFVSLILWLQYALQSIFIFSAEEIPSYELHGTRTCKSWKTRMRITRLAYMPYVVNRMLNILPMQVILHNSQTRTGNLWCPQSLYCNLSSHIYLPTCRRFCCRGFRDLLLQRSKTLLPVNPLIWRRGAITELMDSRHNSSITFSYWLFLSTSLCNEDLYLLTFS